MSSTKASSETIPKPASGVSTVNRDRIDRIDEILRIECVKRGVRFLPKQVVRALLEKEGLL